MKDYRKHITWLLILLMGYYLLPEHYLLGLHPHEHLSTCCSLVHDQPDYRWQATERSCLEKEGFKLLYLQNLNYFFSASSFLFAVFMASAPRPYTPPVSMVFGPRGPPWYSLKSSG